jgi:GH24 family phage-related lysozyme (muramidase)
MASYLLNLLQMPDPKANMCSLRSGIGWNNASAGIAPFAPVMPKSMAGLASKAAPVVAAVPASKTSAQGLAFIFAHEAQKGVSNRLHWPLGKSGVTLGPGYDMKSRDAVTIEADMKAIGVDATTAAAIAKAAGLSHAEAKKFRDDNKDLVSLEADQETALLTYIVPSYEKWVRNSIKIALKQHEFDAMVSFAYNSAGLMASVSSLINAGKTDDAMALIKKAGTSNTAQPGLVTRREDEVRLFTLGLYKAPAE